MLGPGFRRGGSFLFNNSRAVLSRRAMNQHRRALAMGSCLAHNVSLANIAHNSLGTSSFATDLLDAPSLGIGQDLLSDAPTLTDLMGVIEQMGLSHLFAINSILGTFSLCNPTL